MNHAPDPRPDPKDMSPSDIRAEIAEFEKRYPLPKHEVSKADRRAFVLNHVKRGGIAAEIGVFRGWFSEVICREARPSKLYLIDPWRDLGETFGWGAKSAYTAFGELRTADARRESLLRCALYPETEIVPIEGSYPRCSDQLMEKLDFVYLDASHKYDRTLFEMTRLKQNLKPRGVLLGDDWFPDPEHKHHGVYQAVHGFLRQEPDWGLLFAGAANQWGVKRVA